MRGNRFVARLDAKAARKTGEFHVLNLYLEDSVKNRDTFLAALGKELKSFAQFDDCSKVKIHAISRAS